nr:uncharacterized protein LOC112280668 isoform X2 [Physcomitrium patens]|eukprot:XP_024372185.1 uncharacterized protein LOC112280668 isoform X2 [Physcomitrella patens]
MGKQRALSRVFFSWHRGRERDSALVSSCLSRFLGSFKSCEREFWSERLHAQTRPPIASKRPFLKEAHGIKWNDPYHWMSSPSEKAHLTEHVRRENRYADVIMADTLPLQHRLVQEMEGRISAELVTPPERWGSWLYYSKVPEGAEFPVYCRRRAEGCDVKGFMSTHEEILLDQNAIAREFGYAHVGMCKLSADHKLLAYTVDKNGCEEFTLFVKDLSSGQVLAQHTVEGVVSVEWAQSEPSLFYTVADNLMRPFKVYCRSLDSSTGSKLVLQENDDSRFVDVARTKDWRYLTLNVNSKTSSEVHLVDARNPGGKVRIVEPRRSEVEYFVEHHDGFLYILTNSGLSPNYRLVRCPVSTPGSDHWEEVIRVEEDMAIVDMDVFHKHLVLYQRKAGLPRVQILDLPHNETCNERRGRELSLPQQVCSILPGVNQDFFSPSIRLTINSPLMPEATFDYDLRTGESTFLQQNQYVLQPNTQNSRSLVERSESRPPNTNCVWRDLSSLYVCKQAIVTSSDGVHVPLTIFHSRNVVKEGTSPALLLGYGAYGQILETEWCSDRLSLLDRGWVLAFAHVRGGGELGREWHHAGRLTKKCNSFQDFIASANYLVEHGYAHPSKLAAWGISAGGLLVAATINMVPDLFCAAILEVPFVDVCNTMLDPTLPLTVADYDEWGNPEDPTYFNYIREYSPYDTLKERTAYPALLVLASLNDTRVSFTQQPRLDCT